MRTAIFISALAGLAAAAPRPQDIEIDEVIVRRGPSCSQT